MSYPSGAAAAEISSPSAGGDVTLQIDHDFEQIILEEIRLNAPDQPRLMISEELGVTSVPNNRNTEIVIIDPVDGSKNAAQGIPQYSLSVAVADGPTMADVWFGYVYDFGTNEEYVADTNGLPLRDGVAAAVREPPSHRLVGCESAEPALLSTGLAYLEKSKIEEIRVIGSIAIAMSYLAVGRLDGFFTCKECRSVDVAAAQLIARQGGCEVRFNGSPPSDAALDLSARYRVVAGRHETTDLLHKAQQKIPLTPR